ncbi:MAG TPA: hypothetical protein VFZ78_10070 [Flavisolibacter sp.]
MSEKLPYEDMMQNGFDDLPVPDAEQAWHDMRQKLDQEDRRRRIIPPFFLSGCAGWIAAGVLGALLLVTGWFIFYQQDETRDTTTSRDRQVPRQQQQTTDPVNRPAGKESPVVVIPSENNQPASQETVAGPTTVTASRQPEESRQATPGASPTRGVIDHSVQKQVPEDRGTRTEATRGEVAVRPPQIIRTGEDVRVIETAPVDSANENIKVDPALKQHPPDSTVQKVVVTETVPASGDSAIVKQPAVKAKKLAFSAGIGEQQQLPLNGQLTVPYNYYGRKGSLYDYIPSVYMRIHYGSRWFLQGEFRFGAPQSLKEFSFSRKTVYDTAAQSIVTTTMRLKKTYYHQIPVTLNYHVLPNLSVGAGGMYSRFHGAITEQEVRTLDIQSQQEIISKKIVQIPHFTDSFLYRTQVHALLQADYHWKRFSVGLRYKMDLQPFIKYTEPNGFVNTSRNEMLEFMLRFRLWQSK